MDALSASRRRGVSLRGVAIALALLVLLAATPASALLHIDFEQPYYVHPGMQVWDFSLVQDDGGLYHLFYHGIPEATPHPSHADNIWHATSSDLIHWSEPVVALSVSANWYEAQAIWAPDILRDPGTGVWYMAYTGVDADSNQRICMAWSLNLQNWGRVYGNPVLEPDPNLFQYQPDFGWSVCRDPHLYERDGVLNLLAATLTPFPQEHGSILHATSTNFHDWDNQSVFLVNDGPAPEGILESPCYVERDGVHHLFCHSTTAEGITHLSSADGVAWTMQDATVIGDGVAPEVDTFDGGQSWLLSRLGQFRVHPDSTTISFVAHFDTLLFDGDTPDIQNRHPLRREFANFMGPACGGNPILGDNPARRGLPPLGLVGNGCFASAEYFQGPFGNGIAGMILGESATAIMESHPFVIEGRSMTMLLGGSNQPDLCYVELVDAQTDSTLRRAHPDGTDALQEHAWILWGLEGTEAFIRIVDVSYNGHLNVDEIVEHLDLQPTAAAPAAPPAALVDLGPGPNPFNPRTELHFRLAADGPYRARVHDLRGRVVWDSGVRQGRAGPNAVAWSGGTRTGGRAPGGVYVYRIEAAGQAIGGKITLTP